MAQKSFNQNNNNKLSLDQVIVKVTNMVSWDSTANQLAKQNGLDINYVSWEDCARNKFSCWGPCISDMTLRVNESCMPVIRQPNYTDKTWDVSMDKIPIVIGNQIEKTENKEQELQTISLKDYLTNFSDFMTNDYYKKNNIDIDLTSQKENKDSHVIMSSQACFLPIQRGEETKFNVALFNYQSQAKNPAVLTIISTSKGSSAQIIEGKEQHLLFNNYGKKADFIGERVSDHRIKKGQIKNIYDKKLSKEEKQDNCIVVVQVPLKQKQIFQRKGLGMMMMDDMAYGMNKNCNLESASMSFMPQMQKKKRSKRKEESNVEAAIIKVAERTKPTCICGKELQKCQVRFTYDNGDYKGTVGCDGCEKSITDPKEIVYHCPDGKSNYKHKNGYDLCMKCGEKQLNFDELRGMLDNDKSYKLERDERYPIRVTLQYYKATDNGVVNKEIMDDIVKQLEQSQKQADFMGSLVTEYNKNRPNEWVFDQKQDDGDDLKEVKKALKENCGNDWKVYLANFEDQEVKDGDLENLSDEDLRELIPKMGPRNRFKKWMENRKYGDHHIMPIPQPQPVIVPNDEDGDVHIMPFPYPN